MIEVLEICGTIIAIFATVAICCWFFKKMIN